MTPQEVGLSFHDEYFLNRGGSLREQAECLSSVMASTACQPANPEHIAAASKLMLTSNFDVFDFAEFHLRATVAFADLSSLDDKAGAPVLGTAEPEQKRITLCCRTEKYEPLQRATLAHECGHIVLHARSASAVHYFSPMALNRPQEERDADHFMAGLLLPPEVVDLAMMTVARTFNLNLSETWKNRDSELSKWQMRHRYLPIMLNHLCVSRHMLLVHLRRRGFLSNAGFQYHKTYALATPWLSYENSEGVELHEVFGHCPLSKDVDRLMNRVHVGQARA